MVRDKEVNQVLTAEGYVVLRFWGKQIVKDLDSVIAEIEQTVEERRNGAKCG